MDPSVSAVCEVSSFLTGSHIKYFPLLNFQGEIFWGKDRYLETFKWKEFSHNLVNSLGSADEEPTAEICAVLRRDHTAFREQT